jgi:hypothetical protein
MKLRSVTLLLLLASALLSCDKSSDELKDQCFEVKILNEICGNAVVQILDQELYTHGENGYKFDDSNYDHVISTRFSCADMSKLYASSSSLKGLRIKVKVTDRHEDDAYCTRCAATIANAPQKFVLLKVTNDCK